jgi:PAS domain S-box-containing protein
MKEILFIAPYEKLYQMAQTVCEKYQYENVEVVVGDLKSGLDQSIAAVEKGINVVVSRGGTFKMVKEQLNIPVVELQISAYDIMNSTKHIIEQNEPVAIIGFNNIIYGYELLEGLQGINIHKIDIEDKQQISQKIDECVRKSIFTFMGDAIVNTVCKDMGYKCFIIESGEESVHLAIQRAQDILMASKNEVERTKRYIALMDFVHDGVIATDQNNRILAYNRIAQGILGINRENILGQKLGDIPGVEDLAAEMMGSKPVTDEIRKIKATDVALSNIPILVNGENKGSVAVFQDITRIQTLEKKIRTELMNKGFVTKYTFDTIIRKSSLMEKTIETARKFSRYSATILIMGSSGVGKELFAQSIHSESKRKKGPFVAINCAALPSSLIESELFGYVEGAFTGSKKGGKPGVFELAHGGTIFLDEISELPIEVQGRLLRVIQEREVMRVGDNKVIPLDIRIICATNRVLKEMVEKGSFRRDLLYRINVLSFNIPQLQDRKEDIALLSEFFLKKYCKQYYKEIKGFSPKAFQYLLNHNYQGNVRELEGMIERAVIICDTAMIRLGEFDIEEQKDEDNNTSNAVGATDDISEFLKQNPNLKELEDYYIHKVYESQGKSAVKACEILKIDRSTLWRKLKDK